MSAIMRRIGRLEVAPPWSFFTAINTAFAAFLCLTVISTPITLVLFPDQPFDTLAAWSLGALLTLFYVNFSRRNDRDSLRLETGQSRLLIVLLVGLGMAITIDLVGLLATGEFLPAPELLKVTLARDNLFVWLLAIVFMVLLQPLAEQLVFSGVFFPAAQQALGAWGGYIFTALCFALFHYFVYGFPPVNGLWPSAWAPLLAGLVIIAVRANAGSTRSAIVAHMGFGLFALLKLFVLVG